MHEQHLSLVEDAKAHALVAVRCEPIRPVQRLCSQFVAVQIAAPHVQESRAHLIPTRLWITLDEADGLQRAEDAVDRPLRKSQFPS